MHLADIPASLGAQNALCNIREGGHAAAAVRAELAIVFGLHFARRVFLDIAARHDPFAAQRGQAGANVDGGVLVRIGAAGVVDADRFLAALQLYFAHGDTNAAAGFCADMHLAAAANGAGGDAYFERSVFDMGIDVGH